MDQLDEFLFGAGREDVDGVLRTDRLLRQFVNCCGGKRFVIKVETDGQFRWQAGNEAIYRATLSSQHDLTGKCIQEFVPEPASSRLLHRFQTAIADRRVVSWEETVRRPSGVSIVRVEIAPVFREDGVCTNIVGAVEDVTERKKVERELREVERRLTSAQAHARIGNWEWDPKSDTVWWSSEIYRLFGVDARSTPPSFESFLSVLHPDDRPRAIERVALMMKSGESFADDLRVLRPDGTLLWIHSRARAICDEHGSILYVEGTDQDITERKHVEEALRESERRFHELADAVPQIIWTSTPQGVLHAFNARTCEYSGLSEKELQGDGWARIVHPEDLPGLLQSWIEIIASETPRDLEFRLRNSAGEYRWHIGRQIAVRDASGAIVNWYGTCTDIEDRKRSEAEIRRNSDLLNALTTSTSDAVFVKDRSGKYIFVNAAAAQFVGKSSAEIIGHDDSEIFDAESARVVMAGDRLVIESELPITREDTLSSDGGTYSYLSTKSPYRNEAGEVLGVLGIAIDITQRKRDEQRLRESEEMFRALFESCGDAIFVLDAEGRIRSANPVAIQESGYSPAELFSLRFQDLLGEDSAATGLQTIQRLKASQKLPFEVTFRRQDGTRYPAEIVATPTTLEQQEFTLAFARNVSARKEAELERDRLWNNSPVLLCIAGFDGKLKQVNPAWTTVLGWSSQELIESSWRDLVHPGDLEAAGQAEERLFRGETLSGFEDRYRTKDGRWRWFSWNAIPLLDQGLIFSFVRDVTNEKQLAEQFRQAQKMEAIGQLAGGVAHDFNNLLTVINGYSDLLLKQLDYADPKKATVQMIRTAGDKAAVLTSQLLAFSRKAIVEPKLLELNQAVDEFATMIRRLIGENIELIVEFFQDALPVRVDPGQLDQLLLNLVVNARDAMPNGGRLTLSTTLEESSLGIVAASGNLPGGSYARLSIADTGMGMSPEVQSHIFEPFFTTKGVGQGTGLGLATVYGIVQLAGGAISVETAPGSGATFHVWFPLTHAENQAQTNEAAAQQQKGAGTVLIVEDEENVRGLIRTVLEMEGYKVLEACSGQEALAVAAQYTGRIDLLLSDLVMPNIGGRVFAEKWRILRPESAIVLMSGYTEDEQIRERIDEGMLHFMSKPFSPDSLATTVRVAIDAKQGSR